MDIIDIIHEEQELDRLLFEEGRSKMNFVRIGKRVVNLDNVTEMHFQRNGGISGSKPCIVISFVGDDEDYISIYNEDEPDAFSQLMTWMNEQPALLREQRPYVPDEAGTHPPDCDCYYCSAGEGES